jgi:ketosteroid isomerase-like protein
MRANERLIVETAYTAWAEEDLSLLDLCLHEKAVSRIHLPPGAWPMSGSLRGKRAILGALDAVSRNFHVAEYRPLRMSGEDGIWRCHARIHYAHRTSGISYEATIRNIWWIVGDRICSYEVFHDGPRLRAFFDLVSQSGVA